MKIFDITEGLQYEYYSTCENCGMQHLILTQKDSFPEYEIEVYVKCRCGDYVEFILPVN